MCNGVSQKLSRKLGDLRNGLVTGLSLPKREDWSHCGRKPKLRLRMGSRVQELSTLYTVQGCDMTSDCNYADSFNIKIGQREIEAWERNLIIEQRYGKKVMS